jgi:RHS repeat-associated protein
MRDCSHKFTGKERDTESGLDNFGFRYNASTMGRFMTPDVWYGDYRGKANLAFYVNTHESKTIVLVFMYEGAGDGTPPAIEQILKSFSWHRTE